MENGPRPLHRTVLVIDDEPEIRRALRRTLSLLPAAVIEAPTGAEGIDRAVASQPDVVILDLGLPDVPGIEVCRAIRGRSNAPVLVLSARRSEAEKVALLDAGADDYVVKPFGLDELTARVRAQLRRAEAQHATATEHVVRIGPLVIDLDARAVTRDGARVHLTRIEWDLLHTFVAHRGRTLTHRQLFEAVWRRAHGNAQQYLRVHLTNLRRKIEADPAAPEIIVTESGVGYRMVPEQEAPTLPT